RFGLPVSVLAGRSHLPSFPTRRSSDLHGARPSGAGGRVDGPGRALGGLCPALVPDPEVLRLAVTIRTEQREVFKSVVVANAVAVDRKSTRLNSSSQSNLVCRLLLEKKK